MSVSRRIKRNSDRAAYAKFCDEWAMAKGLQRKRYEDIAAEGREPTATERSELGRPISKKPSYNEWRKLRLKYMRAALEKHGLNKTEQDTLPVGDEFNNEGLEWEDK